MENEQKSVKKSSSVLWLILAVVVIGIAAVGYYFFIYKEETNTNTNTVANTNAATNATVNTNTGVNTNTSVDTSGWLTYENNVIGISAKYPNDWKIYSKNDHSVFFIIKENSGAADAVPAGVSITRYNSLKELPNIGDAINIEEWIKANNIETYKKTSFLGLEGYQMFWPGLINTFTFILNKGNQIFNIDLNYYEDRKIDSLSGRPQMTPEEIAFFANIQFLE